MAKFSRLPHMFFPLVKILMWHDVVGLRLSHWWIHPPIKRMIVTEFFALCRDLGKQRSMSWSRFIWRLRLSATESSKSPTGLPKTGTSRTPWYCTCFTVLMLFFMLLLLLLLLLCAVRGIGKNQNLSLPFWQPAVQLKHSELAQSSVRRAMKVSHHDCPSGKWPMKSACPTGKIAYPRLSDTVFIESCVHVVCPCRHASALCGFVHAASVGGGGGGGVSVVSLTWCVPRYGFGESWTCTCTFGHYVRRGSSQQIDLVGMWSVKVDGM